MGSSMTDTSWGKIQRENSCSGWNSGLKKAKKTLQKSNIFIKPNKLLNKENIHLYLFNLIF